MWWQDPERHKEVDALLGAVADEKFAQLVALGKLITDWAPEDVILAGAEGEATLDDDIGVAVEFEDEEEEDEEEELDEVVVSGAGEGCGSAGWVAPQHVCTWCGVAREVLSGTRFQLWAGEGCLG